MNLVNYVECINPTYPYYDEMVAMSTSYTDRRLWLCRVYVQNFASSVSWGSINQLINKTSKSPMSLADRAQAHKSLAWSCVISEAKTGPSTGRDFSNFLNVKIVSAFIIISIPVVMDRESSHINLRTWPCCLTPKDYNSRFKPFNRRI